MTRIVILSSDTDVFVVATYFYIYFYHLLAANGLAELAQRGVGDKTRFIPKNLGKDTKFITPGQIQMELYWV